MASDSKKTILVTGANGQLATEIKALSPGYPQYQFLFTTKEELPIEDSKALRVFFQKDKIDYCINCAAYTAVDKAETEKERAFLINGDAVGELASICRDYQVKLIHISTDYVYEGNVHDPLKENNPVGPINVYGASKLKGEELAINKDPSCLIIRTSWVYSSFGNNFVKTMMRLFKEKNEINVIDNQYGSPTYAADLGEVILEIIARTELEENFSGIVNYSNSGVTTWYEFAGEIKSLMNSNCKINPIQTSSYPTPAKRPLYSVLDTSKIKKMLQIEIPYWKESLKKCIDILKAH